MLVLWMEENQKTCEKKTMEQGQELTANSRMRQP